MSAPTASVGLAPGSPGLPSSPLGPRTLPTSAHASTPGFTWSNLLSVPDSASMYRSPTAPSSAGFPEPEAMPAPLKRVQQ